MAVVTETDQAWAVAGTPKGAGWLAFASTMLFMSGAFKILDAWWAFRYDDDLSEGLQAVLFEGDLTSWGWVWLVAGIALVTCGIAVVSGAQWARWVGIVVAGASAISFFPWIYYQPLWTVLSVGLAVLVIYALAAYGGFARSDSYRGY